VRIFDPSWVVTHILLFDDNLVRELCEFAPFEHLRTRLLAESATYRAAVNGCAFDRKDVKAFTTSVLGWWRGRAAQLPA